MAAELVWKLSIDPASSVAGVRSIAAEAKAAVAAIEASVRQEAQAAQALQRQRSAALIAIWKSDVAAAAAADRQRTADATREANQQTAAAVSLQRQRSAALIAQDRARAAEALAIERSQAAAVESLQKQRSAALVAQLKLETAEAQKAAQAQAAAHLKGAAQTAAGQIQLAQSTAAANATASESLKAYIAQHVPLVAAFQRLQAAAVPVQGSVLNLGKSIADISAKSGQGVPAVQAFLTSFAKLGSQAEKDEASIKFFGASVAQNLGPQLSAATGEMEVLAASGGGVGASLAALSGPVGIAVTVIVVLGTVIIAAATAAVSLAVKFYELAKSTADFEGKLLDLSQQTGVSVETLSALSVASSTTGGSIETVVASLGIFQKKLDEAQDPTSKMASEFRQLGIDTSDTEIALNQTLSALSKMPEGFHQTALALELFGRGGKSVLAILKETGGDLDALKKKLHEKGILISTEDAKAADDFNDQLTILGFQAKALGAQIANPAIPHLVEVLNGFSTLLKDNSEAIGKVGAAIGFLFQVSEKMGRNILDLLNPAVRVTAALYENLNSTLATTAALYERIQAARGGALPVPAAPSGAIGADASVSAAAPLDTNAVRKTLAGAVDPALEARRRAADAAVSDAQREFDAGKLAQDAFTNAVVAAAKIQAATKIQALEHDRAILRATADLTAQDVKGKAESANAILKIDQEIADARAKLVTTVADLEAKARKQSEADVLAHAQRLNELEDKRDALQIAKNNARVAAGLASATKADEAAEVLENHALDRRDNLLKKELAAAGLNEAKQQEIVDKRSAIEIERDLITQRHADIRTAIAQREIEAITAILQSKYARQISTIKALEDSRVISSEEAAQRTLAVQLAANEAEIDAAVALNRDLRLLIEQRDAIIEEGNRNIEAGRKADLDNARSHASILLSIERENAELLIDLMGLNHARRSEIIRAQAQLDRDDEKARHKREVDRLTAIKAENKLIEAENTRHNLALGKIDAREKVQQGEAKGSPSSAIDQLGVAINENLSGAKQTAAIAGLQAMTGAFSDLGQAVGAVVQSFVLYGTSGTSVQKVTAQILASIAQQAAVKAVFELAEGFVALALAFFGVPNAGPSATAHFIAAGIYAGIAGITAVTGREVAGSSFQTAAGNTGSTGVYARNSATGNSPSAPKPINVGRTGGSNAQAPVVVVNLHGAFAEDHFRVKVENAIASSEMRGGKVRQLRISDGVLVQ